MKKRKRVEQKLESKHKRVKLENNDNKYHHNQDDQLIRKLNDIDHALQAGDFYIGQSAHKICPSVTRFIYDKKVQGMVKKTLQYPHGLLKIFDEGLVNAADNVYRGTKIIKVGVNTMKNAIYIYNDGPNIPIVKTEYKSRYDVNEKAYQPEVAFFHPKSSSAYGRQGKVTGGKFGLGAKLIAIFSTFCQIELCDGHMYYCQKTTHNMKEVYQPIVKPRTNKPFLSICFIPDLKLFYPVDQTPTHFSNDFLDLMMTRCIDIAGTTPAKVKVMWGKQQDRMSSPKHCRFQPIQIRNVKDYFQLYLPADLRSSDKNNKELKVAFHEQGRWQVCLLKNPYPYPVTVSFVNNINTYEGGQHVKYIQRQLLEYCRTKVPNIDARRVNLYTMILVNCLIEDPDFNSQCKTTLTSVSNTFGSTCVLPNRFFNVMKRNGVLDALKLKLNEKLLDQARRNINAGRHKPVHNIPHYRNARFAGTRKSLHCTLYIVEGVSALQLANAGLAVVGTDYNGAMALKGKFVNAQLSYDCLSKNEEFVKVCRVLGLEIGKPIPRRKLRYGRVVLLTDQDVDGSHIQGLLLWMFYTHWPHLLNTPGFLTRMITPIVVVQKKKFVRKFFTLQKFERWFGALNNAHTYQVKYYKGLATSTSKEGREYFSDLHTHLKDFKRLSVNDVKMLCMAFDKRLSAQRKTWLRNYDKDLYISYDDVTDLSVYDFVKKDLSHYSWKSVVRAIPCVIDGLTPAGRKCLKTFLDKNIVKDVKLSILSSDVESYTNYHHGRVSLYNTIVHMAQNFKNKQNINLFEPSGMFGSVSDGGQTFGADRYINSRLNPVTRYIFRKEDDRVLTKQFDEGREIEPITFCPIIPMVLINGTKNVGTGFRSNLPCFQPESLIQVIKRRLTSKVSKEETKQDLKSQAAAWWTQPFYHKFTGEIQSQANGNYSSTGRFKVLSTNPLRVLVTDLPIGLWCHKFKKTISKLIEKKIVKHVHECHQHDDDIGFDVTFEQDVPVDSVLQLLQLEKREIAYLNLLSIDEKDHSYNIETYATLTDIFDQWFDYRKMMYERRRVCMIDELKSKIPFLQAKVKFIEIVLAGELKTGSKKSVMCTHLEEKGIDSLFHNRLLGLTFGSLTQEQIIVIQKDLDACFEEIAYFEQVDIADLWNKDLDELLSVLPTFWQGRMFKVQT